MKNLFFAFFVTIAIIACNNANNASSTSANNDTTTISKETVEPYRSSVGENSKSSGIKNILNGYIHLKNALVADDAKDAASAGGEIISAMNKVDQSVMTDEQKKKYTDIADDLKENAQHINENAGNIAHQREHFEMLSKDMEDLVKIFGGGQPLYKDFCSMANDGKGASWLSETKEIKNPYMGKEMPTCGELKEELK